MTSKMPRNLFFVAAMFAALLSTVSAQTVGGDAKLVTNGASWLGASTDSAMTFFSADEAAVDLLVTVFIDMSPDTTGAPETDQTCVQLVWNDGIGIQPANRSNQGCATEVGSNLPALAFSAQIPIHIAPYAEIIVNTNSTVAGWATPHTYNMIVTWTQLNP
jgi:hypothetical protein